jgi:uncharacterized protein
MDPIKIIQKYYDKESQLYKDLVNHSIAVTNKAIEIAKKVPELHPDLKFIKEAAMLHDIGIYLTHAPKIGCNGKEHYMIHGYLGKQILEKEGYPKHALVCERHVGTGLSVEDIDRENIPIPRKNYFPQTIEEEIISFADKFYSKGQTDPSKEKTIEEIRKGLEKFGKERVDVFDSWLKKFKYK